MGFKSFLVLSVVLICLGAVACKTAGDSSEVKVFGGAALSSDNPGDWSAVALVSEDQQVFCTGTLVAPNLVVTAAHCFSLVRPDAVRFESVASPTPVYRKVVAFMGHPNYLMTDYFVSPNFDVGWVKFDGAVPEGFKPAPILPSRDALKRGAPLTIVGYGLTSATGQTGTKLTAKSQVYAALDDKWVRGVLFTDVVPGQGTCGGDSGGPAYVQKDGQWYVVSALHGSGDFTWIYDKPIPALSECGEGVADAALLYRSLRWLKESSGVDLGTPSSAEVNEWGSESTQHQTFSDWCNDPHPAHGAWNTLSYLIFVSNTFDCEAIAAVWRGSGTWHAWNGTFDIRPVLSLGVIRSLFIQAPSGTLAEYTPVLSGVETLDLENLLPDPLLMATMSHIKSLRILPPLPPIHIPSGTSAPTSIVVADNDISWVSGLNTLESLQLPRFRLSDLSPLSRLSNLKSLDLSGAKLGDLKPIGAMASLEKLSLPNCGLTSTSASSLAGLRALTTLDLSRNKLDSLTFLQAMPLETLDLSSNRISDVSTLKSMNTLRRVNLRFNLLSDDDCPIPAGQGTCIFEQTPIPQN